MVYNKGSVYVSGGSRIVNSDGNTEWLKYVSPGAIFRISGTQEFYKVSSVISNIQLELTQTYAGSNRSANSYSITTGVTPNAGLPLLSNNSPDASQIINEALLGIDRRMGNFMTWEEVPFTTVSVRDLSSLTSSYSVFRNPSIIEVGSIVRAVSGSSYAYGALTANYSMRAYINGSVSSTFNVNGVTCYDNIASGQIVFNKRTGGRALVASGNIVSGSPSGTIRISGSIYPIGSDSWMDNDEVVIYGLSSFGVASGAVSSSGATMYTTDATFLWSAAHSFLDGVLMDNFQRGTTRTVLSSSVSGTNYVLCNFVPNFSNDGWALGDFLFGTFGTFVTDLPIFTFNPITIYKSARVNVGDLTVKASHIDFGLNNNQVNATNISIQNTNVSGTLHAVVDNIQSNLNAHRIATGAHSGSTIGFADDGTAPMVGASTVNLAINELKARIAKTNLQGVVDVVVSSRTIFCDDTYSQYQDSFFAGVWWVRCDYGSNAGQVVRLSSFNHSISGQFTLSGTGFSYAMSGGDRFTLLANYVSGGTYTFNYAGDTYIDSGTTIIYSGGSGATPYRYFKVASATDQSNQYIDIPNGITVGANALDVYVDGVMQIKSGEASNWAFREVTATRIAFSGLLSGMEVIFRWWK
jgi:hypothetical protein